MIYVFLKYMHFAGILIVFSCLVMEHMLQKMEMVPGELGKLSVVSLVCGISSVAVLVTGLLLWFMVGKPAEFYTSNPVFHAKVTLFILVGLLSIYQTIYYFKYRKSAASVLSVPKTRIMMVRVELSLLLVIPLLAVAMAQGYGLV